MPVCDRRVTAGDRPMPYYELHEAMEWAGVVGEWRIDVLEEIEETYA